MKPKFYKNGEEIGEVIDVNPIPPHRPFQGGQLSPLEEEKKFLVTISVIKAINGSKDVCEIGLGDLRFGINVWKSDMKKTTTEIIVSDKH